MAIIFQKDDPNARLVYDETGYPKNCDTIIKANLTN